MLAGITETMVELVPNKVRTCAQATVDKAIEVYHTSQDKAKISKNISNKFTRQVFWLLAQPYE